MAESILRFKYSYTSYKLNHKGICSICFALFLLYGHILIAGTSELVLENDIPNLYSQHQASLAKSNESTNQALPSHGESLVVPGTVTQLFEERDSSPYNKVNSTSKKDQSFLPEPLSNSKKTIDAPLLSKSLITDVDLIPNSSNFFTKSEKLGLNPYGNIDGSKQAKIMRSDSNAKEISNGKRTALPAKSDSLDWEDIDNSVDLPLVSRSASRYGSPYGDVDDPHDDNHGYSHNYKHGNYKYGGHHKHPHIVFTGRKVLQEEGSGQECVLATNSGCVTDEECVRRHQFDICECVKTHGRRFGHRRKKCKPIKFSCGAVFQLVYRYSDEYQDESSLAFQDFSQAFNDVIDECIKSDPKLNHDIVSTRITEVERGSTIVSVAINVGQDSTQSPETIVALLKKALVRVPPNNIGYWSNSLQSIQAFSLCDKPETNPCSKNADCLTVNGLDFAGCKCKPGYEDVSSSVLYPGAICSKSLGACEVGTNSGCGSLEICVNIDGSNACICQPPFVKDVFTGECKVASSCDSTNNFGCGLNEVCQPQNFGATCICAPGYSRNLLNGQCEAKPGDECDMQTQIGCKVYAREKCVDVSGRGVCLCIYGYSRNPNTLTCERVSSQCTVGSNTGCPPTEKCEWYGNITVCNCLPGYARNAVTQQCQSDTATIRVRIHLLLVYVPGLENVYSPSFQQLQNILLEAFWYVVSRDPELNQAILDIVILRFLPGSIIADTRFIIQSSTNVSGNYIKETIQNSIIPPEPVFQSLRFKDATIEDVEEESPCSDPKLNYCSVNATCYPKGSVYKCKCLPGYRDISTPGLTGEICEMECSDLYCTSNGGCYFEGSIRKCRCTMGHYGKMCQINGIAILITLVITILLIITLTITMVYKSKTKRIREKNAKLDGDNFARREVGKDGRKKMKGIAEKSRGITTATNQDDQGAITKYRKFSIGSEKPNLVEIISSRGENIESTASTSVAAGANFINTMAPNQPGQGPSARDLNNGSPLRIITRNSFRQIGKNEEYTPWWHSENTETEGSLNDETDDGNGKGDSPQHQRHILINGGHHDRDATMVHHPMVPPPPMPPRLPG